MLYIIRWFAFNAPYFESKGSVNIGHIKSTKNERKTTQSKIKMINIPKHISY